MDAAAQLERNPASKHLVHQIQRENGDEHADAGRDCRTRLARPHSQAQTAIYIICMVITYSKSKDQPGKVADPARGQLSKENEYFPLPSTCPLHTNSGCGKERRILIGPWRPVKAALVRNYLEVYWPCAGGLSAVNAIGTQLRDPINSRLTRWRMAVS